MTLVSKAPSWYDSGKPRWKASKAVMTDNSEYYEPGVGNIADAAHQYSRQIGRTRVVGQKERRVDARPLVTGAPVYAAEFEQPNMLHARVLHSPHAHANILHIDTSKANTLLGVRAVLRH